MRVLGTLKFSIEATGTEKGGVRKSGDYALSISSLTMPLTTDVSLAKNALNQSVGLGGITTVKFLHVKAVFDDDTVANADINLKYTDANGTAEVTGTEFMLIDCAITVISLTNNSNDTTGSKATVFIDLVGD